MTPRTNRTRRAWPICLIAVAACAPARSGGSVGGCGASSPTEASLVAAPGARVEPPAWRRERAEAPSTALALDINIPAFRLDVYEDGRRTRSYPIAVGMRKYPTPRGSYFIDRLEWYPWWIPPKSDWARQERPTPPGPGNPLGDVKLSFKPTYLVHGTPREASLGHAASHGCIRMANAAAVALARLVYRYGVPDDTSGALDRLIADRGVTRVVMLQRPIPISLRYEVAEVRDDSLRVYPDIYRLMSGGTVDRVIATLVEAGVDTAELDRETVRSVIRRSAAGAQAVPIRALRPGGA